jgi:hypothetical protein
MNAIGGVNHALYANCLDSLANCTAKQLELLQKFKEGREALNSSSHVLNELIYNKLVFISVVFQFFLVLYT